MEEKYHEHIPKELVQKVHLGLQHVNFDNFLPSLHECILFRMTVKQDTSHEDYVDNADHPYVVFCISVDAIKFFLHFFCRQLLLFVVCCVFIKQELLLYSCCTSIFVLLDNFSE